MQSCLFQTLDYGIQDYVYVLYEGGTFNILQRQKNKQAGAELCQAQYQQVTS